MRETVPVHHNCNYSSCHVCASPYNWKYALLVPLYSPVTPLSSLLLLSALYVEISDRAQFRTSGMTRKKRRKKGKKVQRVKQKPKNKSTRKFLAFLGVRDLRYFYALIHCISFLYFAFMLICVSSLLRKH